MKVFGVDYQFLSCGSVFTDGLAHAAEELGIDYMHSRWDTADLESRISVFDPDLVFVVHGRHFTSRFLNAGLDVLTPLGVWLLDEPYEVDDTSRWSLKYDHVFLNDTATLDRHENASYLPVCYDPRVHYSDGGLRPHKVGFIGGGNSTRDRYLGALARAGHLTYVVGGAWADSDVNARCLASGNLTPSNTATLYRGTRIVVNVFREEHHFNSRGTAATSLNPRIYEALACGALVVSEWRPEIDSLVPELPTFQSEAECVELVANLLAHPDEAEAIRLRCAARILPHTYAARLQTVLTTVGLKVAA